MGIVFLVFGLGMLCILLWYCAVYALPLYAGFATGFWALGHGAGAGAIAVGLVVGVAVFVLGRYAVLSSNPAARWLAVIVFTLPAAYAGYCMVTQLSEAAIASSAWRVAFGIASAMAVGATALARLLAPHEQSGS
jgi:hypothetical protein